MAAVAVAGEVARVDAVEGGDDLRGHAHDHRRDEADGEGVADRAVAGVAEGDLASLVNLVLLMIPLMGPTIAAAATGG